jgi:peroxiredoxin
VRKFIFRETLTIGLLVFALCGSASGADPFTGMGVIKPKVRMEAPAFNLKDIEGGMEGLADYKGKVIILNFWATWCPNCIEEMPSLQRLWEKFRVKGVEVIAVAVDRKIDNVKSFAQRLGLTFPVLLDTDGMVRKNYEVSALPITYIIGKDGKISGRIFGGRDWAGKKSDALMEHLLK